jgi:hypothetical protein
VIPNRPVKTQQGWATIGGQKCYFRSGWELQYAKYLQFLKENKSIKEWEYEPQTFWFEGIKRGVRSYLPDFRITENNGSQNYVEVKGYYDKKSQTKMKRMKKYHPDVVLHMVWGEQMKEIRKKFSFLFK